MHFNKNSEKQYLWEHELFYRGFYLNFCCIYLGIYESAWDCLWPFIFLFLKKDNVLDRSFFMLLGIDIVSVESASELAKTYSFHDFLEQWKSRLDCM